MIAREFETIKIENWYEISRMDNDVVAIWEPKHQEEVFCYLIKGQTKDLLIDTGMGVVPITRALEKLRNSSKELVVANTHWHFDHVGGNSHFEKVLVPKNIDEVAGMFNGCSQEDLEKYGFADGFHQPDGTDSTPIDFDAKKFSIAPCRNIDPVLKNGYKIDLGNRDIFVIETPGHTPGGVCFCDKSNGLLFTGDMLYEGPLYAFDNESNPDLYLKSLRKIKRMLGDKLILHPGHNYPENLSEPNFLIEAIKLLSMAKDKKAYDDKSHEFSNAVEYMQPGQSTRHAGGRRRLKLIVHKDYVKWE